MIRRLLVLFGAALLLLWWLRRLVAGPGQARRRARPVDSGTRRQPEPMVRDRICNTFIPRSRALTERVGADEHFFCSERCREAFLAGSEVRRD